MTCETSFWEKHSGKSRLGSTRIVKRLTEFESRKARERQTQAFEEDKKKKNKEKENKKRAIVKEILSNCIKNNERYLERCIKPKDFLKRNKGRRSSDSISSYQQSSHLEDMVGHRKSKSPEQEPRYCFL